MINEHKYKIYKKWFKLGFEHQKQIGIGLAGVIYAGTLTKDKKQWVNKSDVTDEVVAAFWEWLQEQYEEAIEETELECGQRLEKTISYPSSEYEIVFRKKKDGDMQYEPNRVL